MKNLSRLLLVPMLVSFVSITAFAEAPLLQGEKAKQNIGGENALIYSGAVNYGSQALVSRALGLRKKRVVMMIPIYAGQLLVSDPYDLNLQNNADAGAALSEIGALADGHTVAMQLSFVSGMVDRAKLSEAFREVFNSNQIPFAGDSANPVAKAVMDWINPKNNDSNLRSVRSFKVASTLTVLGQKRGDQEYVAFEYQESATAEPLRLEVTAAQGALHAAFALWLGTLPPNDNGLNDFKNALLAGLRDSSQARPAEPVTPPVAEEPVTPAPPAAAEPTPPTDVQPAPPADEQPVAPPAGDDKGDEDFKVINSDGQSSAEHIL